MPEDRREAHYHECLNRLGPQYAGFDFSSSQLSLALLFTYDVFHQIVSRYMASYGLSKSTLNILMLLRNAPAEGMQLHDLGELLLVSRANITGLIDHLEEKGYVTRVVDVQDRRARYARITRKAEALLDEFIPVHYGNIQTLLSDLTSSEKEAMITLLKKTRNSLMAHSEECVTEVCDVSHG